MTSSYGLQVDHLSATIHGSERDINYEMLTHFSYIVLMNATYLYLVVNQFSVGSDESGSLD